ncbi:hypothetical protein L249_5288, partial [Ophiocordyceps polyrhachis-furcata BCC 54312]
KFQHQQLIFIYGTYKQHPPNPLLFKSSLPRLAYAHRVDRGWPPPELHPVLAGFLAHDAWDAQGGDEVEERDLRL